MTITKQLEIWQQFGGYISGIKSIALSFPELSSRQIINAMKQQNYMGGWSDEVVTNAVNSVRA